MRKPTRRSRYSRRISTWSDPLIRSRRGSPRLTWGPRRPRWRAARRSASPSHYRWPRCLLWPSRRSSPGCCCHRYCCPLQPRNPLARPPIHVPNLLLRRGTSSVVAILQRGPHSGLVCLSVSSVCFCLCFRAEYLSFLCTEIILCV